MGAPFPAVVGTDGAVARPRGSIDLTFARSPGGNSYVSRQFAAYPFHVCRPHRFDGDPAGMATLYVQSCAGGIFEDDRLIQSVTAAAGAGAHVTTQASTIVHGMRSGEADQETRLVAEAGAFLEFLPDPLILFPRARLRTRLVIRAHPDATIVVCDSFHMHDPAARGGVFDWLAGEIAVETLSGETVALDRMTVRGEVMAAGLAGISGRYRAHGSLMILDRGGRTMQLVEALRDALATAQGVHGGASTLPGGAGAWLRLLADDGATLRHGLHSAWAASRSLLTGRTPHSRRK
jgi:urease accessory protein